MKMEKSVVLGNKKLILNNFNLKGKGISFNFKKKLSYSTSVRTTFIKISIYRIYPAIRRGFCPSGMTSNN